MAWKVEVIADNSGKWCSNLLRFETEAEAKVYAFELMMRWTLVRDTRVVKTDEPVTEPVRILN
jgi:hypothetical protein